MDIKTRGSVIFCLFNLILGTEGGYLTDPLPKNTAVQNGTRVILNCTATLGHETISWGFYDVLGSGPFTIAFGSQLTPGYNTSYVVEMSVNQINLIILTATPSTAGTYVCNLGEERKTAQLIVVNSGPLCSSSVSQSTELFQNQDVQMTCTIEYVATSSHVGINIVWLKMDPFSPVNSPSPQITTKGSITTAVSTLIQTTGSQSPFPVYQSDTTFQMKSNLPNGSAANTPNYTNFCLPFNSSIPVNYFSGSSLKVIRTKSDSVYQGENISCSVDANPAANYSWLDVTFGNTTNTSSIRIWHNGEYECTAWNKVNSTSVTVNLTVQGEGNNNNAIIIGVVVGGTILLVLIGVLIYCCIKKKKKSG